MQNDGQKEQKKKKKKEKSFASEENRTKCSFHTKNANHLYFGTSNTVLVIILQEK